MNSVYSLVLSDELVAAIDREAAQAGKSRSAMVGEILAQHLAVETPKQRDAGKYACSDISQKHPAVLVHHCQTENPDI